MTPNTPERFWERVDKSGECWLWQGARLSNGYGVISWGNRTLRVHRLSYELAVGPIPAGMEIDHVKARGCKYRHCVNPGHLEAVTQVVNNIRGDSPWAINKRKTACVRGHLFTPENTRMAKDGTRNCRACNRQRVRVQRQKRRAA